MAIISLNYDEGHEDLNYKSIVVNYSNLTKTKIFDSGDFIIDWFNAVRFLILTLADDTERIMHSSSVDHFIMDGGCDLYDSAYLCYVNNEFELYYDNTKNGIEFFVPKGTKPTWNEFKNANIK